MATPVDAVIVGEGDVEWVLLWAKGCGSIAVGPCSWVGVVETSEVELPFGVPRAGVVWCGVLGSGSLTDPEDSGRDVLFPRVGLLLKWIFRCSG